MITITLIGFQTKEQAAAWLNQYQGGIEQHFDTQEPIDFPAMCDMRSYIEEMESFQTDNEKLNFNINLK